MKRREPTGVPFALLGWTLAGAAIAACPVWWAVAGWWDVRDLDA